MELGNSPLDFDIYLTSIKRHKLPTAVVFCSIIGILMAAAFIQEPTYEAEGKILIKPVSSIPQATSIGQEIGQTAPLYKDTKPLDTEAETIRSLPLVQKTIDKLGLKDSSDPSLPLKFSTFVKQLTISQANSSDILKVNYKDIDPDRTAKVANTLMEIYIENNVLVNRAEVTAARKFLEKELPKAEFTLRRAEFELRKFKEQSGVISLDKESQAVVNILTTLQQQVANTQAQALNAKIQAEVLSNEIGLTPEQAVSLTTVSQSSGIQDVLLTLQEAERDLAVAQTNLNEAHPKVSDLKQKVAALKTILSTRFNQTLGKKVEGISPNSQVGTLQQNTTADLIKFRAQNIALENQATALSKVLESYRLRANTLPRIEQILSELQGNLQAAQSTYKLIRDQYQETQIAENQTIGNTRIIASAQIPTLPIAPRKSLYLIGGILLGSVLACFTALLLESKNKSIRTVEEAQDLLNLPLLGVIPMDEVLNNIDEQNIELTGFTPEVVVRSFPRSLISESYWMLVSNLQHLLLTKELKRVVVTSSELQEGKSTVSANLAAAISQLGFKVLLMDANLRNPRQQQIWHLNDLKGLSNLINDEIELQVAIQKIDKNLDIMTAGMLPPSPAALLGSLRMNEIMESISRNYDLIIIDTPPLSSAPDALTLSHMADGVLLVLKVGSVEKSNARSSKEILEKITSHKILGFVVNGIISNNEPYNYYHFEKAQQTNVSDTLTQ